MVAARHEFRLFGDGAEAAGAALGLSTAAEPNQLRQDLVLLMPEAESWLVTWHADALEFSRRDHLHQGLECWQQAGREALPLSQQRVADLLLPALGLVGSADDAIRDWTELVQRLLRPGMRFMHRQQQRWFLPQADGVRLEWTRARINGAELRSLGLVAPTAAVLQAAVNQAGLGDQRNCNWLLALRRLAGLAPLATDSPDRVPTGAAV